MNPSPTWGSGGEGEEEEKEEEEDVPNILGKRQMFMEHTSERAG